MALTPRAGLFAYSVLRQAERSLAHALPWIERPGVWLELQGYYDRPRIALIEQALAEFCPTASHVDDAAVTAVRDRMRQPVTLAWAVRRKLRAVIRLIGRPCSVPLDEAQFVRSCLTDVLRRLAADSAPAKDDMYWIMRDTNDCQGIILACCPFVRIIERAAYVENYLQPDHLTHHSIEEIIGGTGQ